jgi:D-glycero-alpha-D-manno-heptose 1-phosphate guanylyltransferase
VTAPGVIPIPAIVLVGGLGTRLRALYPDKPKALVPIRGRPFLAWLLDWLRAHGVSRIHLAAGYRGEQIAEWAAAHVTDALTISREPEPLGTGGGLRYALEHVAGPDFFALNGDSFVPALDLAAWLASPPAREADAEIAVTRIDAPGRYGVVEFDTGRRIRAFFEKADRPAGWVNAGIYRFQRSALEAHAPGSSFSLETDYFPARAAAGRLIARPVEPPLLDMGTPDGIRALESWLASHPPKG